MVSLKMGGRSSGVAKPVAKPKRGRGASLGLVVVLILASLVIGGLIGLGAGVFVLAALVLVATAIALLASGALSDVRFGGEGVFWAILIVVLGGTCMDALSPVRTRGLTTVVLFAFAYLGWRGMRYFVAESRLGKAMLLFFGIFFVCGVIGAIHPHWHLKAVAYQIAYNLKLPIMISLGFCVVWSEKSERRFWLVLRCFLVYGLLMLGFQAAAPGVYGSVAMGAGAPSGSNPFLHFLPLMTGPFSHPGVLAFQSSLFLCLFLARHLSGQGKPWGNFLTIAGFAVMLLVSGERQETFDAVIACAVLLFVNRSTYSVPKLLVGACLCAILGTGLLFILGTDKLVELFVQFGILPSPQALDTPRAILYNDAFYLAHVNFPFGTGFGTYGGEASRLFDRSVYEMLGYSHRYWWYRQSLFLLDTYWPNLIAEAGFIGAAMVFLAAICMAWYALRAAWASTDTRAKMLWSMALAGQLLALGDSFTSPNYGDANASSIPFVFFGIAFVYARQLRQRQSTAVSASSTQVQHQVLAAAARGY